MLPRGPHADGGNDDVEDEHDDEACFFLVEEIDVEISPLPCLSIAAQLKSWAATKSDSLVILDSLSYFTLVFRSSSERSVFS